VVIALLALGCLLQSAPSARAAFDFPGELIVWPANNVSIAAINTKYTTQTIIAFTGGEEFLVHTATLNKTLALMSKDSKLIKRVEANVRVHQPGSEFDGDSGADSFTVDAISSNGATEYAAQWGVAKTSLLEAQNVAQGRGIVVAVLDTAVDRTHPALEGRTLPPIDLIAADPQVNQSTSGEALGHGTFVAGVILRIAPQATILPVRVLNDDGIGTSAIVAEGIRRAVKARARVVNLSLDSTIPSSILQSAVQDALAKGVVVVAATGNDGLKASAVFPAGFAGVLSVVATDQQDRQASFSNLGRGIAVGAPGVGIVGPWHNGTYALGNGTSFAAPWVSGQAALLFSSNSKLTGKKVIQAITGSVDSVQAASSGSKVKFGRINIARSLARAK
jgi:subtilisin family serine protease